MSEQRGMRAGGRTIALHRPDKVLFPDDGFTKADLAEHYRAAARRMLPHLRDRPLMMVRHPDGIGEQTVVQKNVPAHFPGWIRRAELPRRGERGPGGSGTRRGSTVTHVVCNDTATLVYLADQACITPHRWLARTDRPDHPDRLVFDLDPSEGTDFEDVRWTAHRVCELLDELGLPVLLMTTGSSGTHALVPLDRSASFDGVRAFAASAAGLLAERHPDRLTTEQRKADRKDRVYLDVQRNAYAQTAVVPYAVRALPGAPVAMPFAREELDDPELSARRWTMATAADRLTGDDPWSPAPRGRSLRVAERRLSRMR
ncbi:non-homologous end-joining DNA ligase [Streptomyces sp. NPDC051776]|uniref:non-homologous end-joining DNA ligase n=1 Tax=Streptomyces sp. NPDC051776 TaxID=3155414 RepID=UPI0034486BEE